MRSPSVRMIEPEQGSEFWVLGDRMQFKLGSVDSDGAFEFQIGERNFTARRGAVVHVPPQTLHSFRSAEGSTAKLISFHTPAGMEAFFEECGTVALPGSMMPNTPIDPAWAVALMRKHGMDAPAM